ncbi:MAG: DUF4234 domain-containing protein [Eubacterium sp.]|nr:DUF4234 domain-containing protein [Eubacterium sp.]
MENEVVKNEVVKKNSTINMVAAIVFAVLAVTKVFSFGNWIFGYGMFASMSTVVMVAELAAAVILALGFASEKNRKLVVIGLGIFAALEAYSFISGFSQGYYNVSYGYSWSSSYDRFNFFCLVPFLADLAAYVAIAVIAVFAIIKKEAKYEKTVRTFWFIPAACLVASLFIAIVVYAITDGDWEYGYYMYVNGASILGRFLSVAALAVCGLALAYPEGFKGREVKLLPENVDEQEAEGMQSAPVYNGSEENGYIDMIKHILLLIFTFGIWYLIWIYKTTDYLNKDNTEAPRSAGIQTILCLFVPFYSIYWVYKSAQRIDRIANGKGLDSDITVLCMILAIFVSILAPVFMQDKINAIASAATVKTTAAETIKETVEVSVEETVEVEAAEETVVEEPAEENKIVEDVKEMAEVLKTLKELLDAGIITQEEFDAKKKQVLGL